MVVKTKMERVVQLYSAVTDLGGKHCVFVRSITLEQWADDLARKRGISKLLPLWLRQVASALRKIEALPNNEI